MSDNFPKEFVSLVEAGRQKVRDLNFIDGVCFDMREGKSVLIEIVSGRWLSGEAVFAGTDCADKKRKGLLHG